MGASGLPSLAGAGNEALALNKTLAAALRRNRFGGAEANGSAWSEHEEEEKTSTFTRVVADINRVKVEINYKL